MRKKNTELNPRETVSGKKKSESEPKIILVGINEALLDSTEKRKTMAEEAVKKLGIVHEEIDEDGQSLTEKLQKGKMDVSHFLGNLPYEKLNDRSLDIQKEELSRERKFKFHGHKLSDSLNFDIWIDPGDATIDDVQELFQALSDLNRSNCGNGFVFTNGPTKAFSMEVAHG
jgi:hypothetical protein